MTAEPTAAVDEVHPVYASVNRPLTIGGADRRLFFVAVIVAGAAFAFFGSVMMSGILGVALFGAARWSTERDPQGLAIVFRSAAASRMYDPGRLAFVTIATGTRR